MPEKDQFHPVSMSGQGRGKRVVFLHPDLGIGGAERLVVDAAVALQVKYLKLLNFFLKNVLV